MKRARGGGGGQYNLEQTPPKAAMPKGCRQFEQFGVHPANGAVGCVEIDPEHRNGDHKRRTGRVQPEPQNGKRHPGQTRHRPQQPHDTFKQIIQHSTHAAQNTHARPQNGADQ